MLDDVQVACQVEALTREAQMIGARANEVHVTGGNRVQVGGGGRIRTPGSLRHAGFQNQCIRPLCHASVGLRLAGERPGRNAWERGRREGLQISYGRFATTL